MRHGWRKGRLKLAQNDPRRPAGSGAEHYYQTTRPMMDGAVPHKRDVMTVDHVLFTPASLELVSAESIWDTDHLSDHLAIKTAFRPVN